MSIINDIKKCSKGAHNHDNLKVLKKLSDDTFDDNILKYNGKQIPVGDQYQSIVTGIVAGIM